MKRSRTMLLAAGVALALVLTTAARAQEAARLAPPDAAVFLEVKNAADWRKDIDSDPLVKYLQEQSPMKRQHKAWLLIQAAMGMTGPQIVDRYFGSTTALVVAEPGDRKPGVILTEVTQQDFDVLKARLTLREIGQVAQFNAYTTEDGNTRIAYGNGWMVFAGAEFEDYFNQVLQGAFEGPSLADNAEFKKWVSKLPAQREVVGYLRDDREQAHHAIAAQRRSRDVTIHYAGYGSRMDGLFSKLGNAQSLQFGPLPASTIAAMTLNIIDREPQNTAFVDRLLAPRTLKNDVLPMIDAPAVLFLGEVPGDQVDPNPGLAVPVLGLAMKLKDAKVAAELDRLLDGLVLLGNVATVQWQTDPIELRVATHNNVTYRVAEVGQPLSQRADRPELKSIKLAYGQVGDWYVLTTQDVFFRQLLDARANAGQSLEGAGVLGGLPLKQLDRPVGSIFVRAQPLAAHLQTWLDHWQAVRPEVMQAADENPPRSHEARAVRGVKVLQNAMTYFQSMTMQASRDEEGALSARIDIVRAK